MNTEAINFLMQLLTNSRISHFWWQPPYENVSQYDLGLRKRIFPGSPELYDGARQYVKTLKGNSLAFVSDKLNCRYVFMNFENDNRACLSIGPMMDRRLDDEEIMGFLKKTGIPSARFSEIQEYYTQIPMMPRDSTYNLLFTSIADMAYGGAAKYEVSELQNSEDLEKLDSIYEKNELLTESPLQKVKWLEERYRLENELIEAVESGNTRAALDAHRAFLGCAFPFPSRLGNQLRDRKDLAITYNTLLRKAVERCSVHPMHIDEVSNRNVIMIEQLDDINLVSPTVDIIISRYCSLIREHSLRKYSAAVQNAINYINTDLTADLSLRALSRQLNINASYLSAIFHKDTGKSLTDYINTLRIKKAGYLLLTTPLPVQVIADEVGIPDYNYFGRLFKRITGIFPKKYRAGQLR